MHLKCNTAHEARFDYEGVGMGNKAKRHGHNSQRVGYCNICNEHGPLTWDHVPPKGSTRITAVEIRNFAQQMDYLKSRGSSVDFFGSKENSHPKYPRRSPNGVKFQTICADCNNERLGARYDLELNRVSRQVNQLARAHFGLGLHVPGKLRITVRTHFLMRSLIGHLLASDDSRDRSKPVPQHGGWYDDLRNYFLDESRPLPESLRLYYWPYPSEDMVIISGVASVETERDGAVLGDLIKFFPMAYFITNSEISSNLGNQLPSIYGDGCCDLDCEGTLHINFAHHPPLNWPEMPDTSHLTIMPLSSSNFSRKRQPRRF